MLPRPASPVPSIVAFSAAGFFAAAAARSAIGPAAGIGSVAAVGEGLDDESAFGGAGCAAGCVVRG
jgi:hypothetical protein